jgi:hypothetical protein
VTQYADPVLPAIFTANQKELRQFDRDLITALGNWSLVLKAILDRGVSFDDNLDIERVSVTSHATPGTEFSVAHGLGKVPTGYIVYGQDGAGSIYDGATSNTKTTLYLKSDVASKTFRIIVF